MSCTASLHLHNQWLTRAACREGRYNLADTRFFSTPPVHGALCKYIDHPAGALLCPGHLSAPIVMLYCSAALLVCWCAGVQCLSV